MVDDNFHCIDKDDRWILGDFVTLDDARRACMALVEKCLLDCYQTGMDAEVLYSQYVMFADDPFIRGRGSRASSRPGTLPMPAPWKFVPPPRICLMRCLVRLARKFL